MVVKLVFCVLLTLDIIALAAAMTAQPELVIRDNVTGREILNIKGVGVLYQILITCYDYNALDQFKLSDNYTTYAAIFRNCFNNVSDHLDYKNFELYRVIAPILTANESLYTLILEFSEYGIVDGRRIFNNFNFDKYISIIIKNVGLANTQFLQNIKQTQFVDLNNICQVDFANFADGNSITIIRLYKNKIQNFTKFNVAKFVSIITLDVRDFSLDDYDALNVANLFEHNTKLSQIIFRNSLEPITLHEDIFNGAHKLANLELINLKMETLPSKLFRDLPQLSRVSMLGNNFRILDSNLFSGNQNLHHLEIEIGGNNLENFRQLQLTNQISITLQNVSDFDSLLPMFENSLINKIIVENCATLHASLLDFTRDFNRSTNVEIRLTDSPIKMSLVELRAKNIMFDVLAPRQNDNYTDLNASKTIEIWIGKHIACPQYIFDAEMFMLYVDMNLEIFIIHLRQLNMLVKLRVNNGALEARYEYQYSENCPKLCTCSHNPLLDDVYIDCRNQNFSEVPVIPYPAQIPKIDQIHLNLNENLLTVIEFKNQDDQVLRHLTKIYFRNNPITKIMLSANFHINATLPCITPTHRARNELLSLNFDDKEQHLNREDICGLRSIFYKQTFDYLRLKPKEIIAQILTEFPCNPECSKLIIDH